MATGVAETLAVGLVQADLIWQAPAENRRRLAELMDREPGCNLYVLPETFTTGFLGDAGLEAEDMHGPTLAWMQEQAAARQAAIAGSVIIASERGRRFNRFVFMAPGQKPRYYDKRHRFSFGGEDQRYGAGGQPVVIDWRGWRIDLQVCYDLRFPVWCRNDRQFDLQLYVANWPSARVEHWRSLLKARAIENQAYVIGVNRSGRDGRDVAYPGCSSAWDPMGGRLLELPEAESVAVVDLHRQQLDEVRRCYPFLADADDFSLLRQ